MLILLATLFTAVKVIGTIFICVISGEDYCSQFACFWVNMESEHQPALTVSTVSALVIYEILEERRKQKRKSRRFKLKQMYRKENEIDGISTHRNISLSQHINGQWKHFTRMTSTDFEALLNMVAPLISNINTRSKNYIPIEHRLAITLRFLFSGDSYTSLQEVFNAPKKSISCIIPEVCSAIIEKLRKYIALPSDSETWLEKSKGFEERCDIPHCLGVIDKKLVVLRNTNNNIANVNIALFAVVDADYNFLFVDADCVEKNQNGLVFTDYKMYDVIQIDTLKLPSPQPLTNRSTAIPYFFIAGGTFPLSENVMIPYDELSSAIPAKGFLNNRMMKVKMVADNAFGVLSSAFQVLTKPLRLEPDKIKSITLACTFLHNYLRYNSRETYSPPGTFDSDEYHIFKKGTWRNDGEMFTFTLSAAPKQLPSRNDYIRDELVDYYVSRESSSFDI